MCGGMKVATRSQWFFRRILFQTDLACSFAGSQHCSHHITTGCLWAHQGKTAVGHVPYKTDAAVQTYKGCAWSDELLRTARSPAMACGLFTVHGFMHPPIPPASCPATFWCTYPETAGRMAAISFQSQVLLFFFFLLTGKLYVLSTLQSKSNCRMLIKEVMTNRLNFFCISLKLLEIYKSLRFLALKRKSIPLLADQILITDLLLFNSIRKAPKCKKLESPDRKLCLYQAKILLSIIFGIFLYLTVHN